MSWYTVVALLEKKRCFERQRTGGCGCSTKRNKHNPCERIDEIIEAANSISIGLPAFFSPDEIATALRAKSCGLSRGRRACNHQSCIAIEEAVDWLTNRLAAVA